MDQLLGAVEIGHRVREVVRQRLERAERLVELAPVEGVLGGDLEGVASTTDGLGGQEHQARLEHALPGGPARPGGTDAIGLSQSNIGERDLVLRVRGNGELLAHGHARSRGVDEEQVYVLVAVTRASQHD